MSHIPQRKEKDCLNCGTIVQGRYCQSCGQENVVPKETFWHMVTHFFYDIVHFDSKFFTTLKDLVFRPGFLSSEYMKGRRASYLHPIKMYVFTSAVFFLLFFGFFSSGNTIKIDSSEVMTGKERLAQIRKVEERLRNDTSRLAQDTARQRRLQKLELLKDTTRPLSAEDLIILEGESMIISITGRYDTYKTVESYDSAQKKLPSSKRDGWLYRKLARKEIKINHQYRYNEMAAWKKLSDTVLHRLPYMLFVSLPLFALILKLLYVRRKNFYYADHGVFTIHLYIFSFILLLAVFLLNMIEDLTGFGILNFVSVLLFIGLNFYLYKAMRRFYGQRRLKTFVKFTFTAILSLVMMIFLLIIFFLFSAFDL